MTNSSLHDVIRTLSGAQTLPHPLPLAHTTLCRFFGPIVSDRRLLPRHCRYFGDERLYFYYGGLFYRPAERVSRDTLELPTAFLFSPRLLETIDTCYPFDTGAVLSGMSGAWSERLDPLDNFAVPVSGDLHAASRLVRHIYESNRKYLRGDVSSACQAMPVPFPNLHSFLTADLTALDIDHRQCAIECHTTAPAELRKFLIWVGFPETMTEVFARLNDELFPDVPQYYAYSYHRNFDPSEIAAQLQLKAAEIVGRYEDAERSGRQS